MVYFILTYIGYILFILIYGLCKICPHIFFIIVRFILWGFLNKYSWSHLIDLCFELIAQAYDYLSHYLALHLPLLNWTYVHSYLHLWVFVFNLNAQSIICITYRTSSTIDVFFPVIRCLSSITVDSSDCLRDMQKNIYTIYFTIEQHSLRAIRAVNICNEIIINELRKIFGKETCWGRLTHILITVCVCCDLHKIIVT